MRALAYGVRDMTNLISGAVATLGLMVYCLPLAPEKLMKRD